MGRRGKGSIGGGSGERGVGGGVGEALVKKSGAGMLRALDTAGTVKRKVLGKRDGNFSKTVSSTPMYAIDSLE